jgi:glutamate formiminotransferase
LTQRKLTADEQEVVYNLMRSLNRAALLIDARGSAAEMIRHAGDMVRNGTTDGKPLAPIERVPTAADIGRKVKVRSNETNP